MSEEEEVSELKTVVGGILQGLRQAKYLGDLESARLYEAYKENPFLARLSVPAFTVSDLELELRFAIVGPTEEPKKEGEVPDLKINISPIALKELEPHQVSVMKLKITPVSIRVVEESS